MAELLGGKGKVAIVSGPTTSENAIARSTGMSDGLKGSAVELVGIFPNGGKPTEVPGIVQSILDNNPDLKWRWE